MGGFGGGISTFKGGGGSGGAVTMGTAGPPPFSVFEVTAEATIGAIATAEGSSTAAAVVTLEATLLTLAAIASLVFDLTSSRRR